MKPPTDEEIQKEIEALTLLAADKGRFGRQAREELEAQLDVLRNRMTPQQIESRYYVDETMDDYEESDNDAYNAAVRAGEWMNGANGYEPPSKGA